MCAVKSQKNDGIINTVFNTFQKYYGEVKSFFDGSSVKMSNNSAKAKKKFVFNKDFGIDDITESNMSNKIIIPDFRRSATFPEFMETFTKASLKLNPALGNAGNITKEPRVIMPMKSGIDAAQLISSVGYRSETHTVLTSDGYMLTMQRILPESEDAPKQAIMLHHGLLGSSEDWLLLGPGLSLPFLLVDKGYDVWLLNARGNKYSKGHTVWYTESYDFWDFSFHEMGIYDLPATITYISEYTNDADLYFIGHSMGASALLALLSTLPEYNEMLKSAFFLAPLAFVKHAKGPMKQFSVIRRKKGISALSFLGTNDFLPNGVFPQDIIEKFCKGSERLCLNPVLLLTNGGEIGDDDLMDNILAHVPAGGSAMTILHYIQLVKSGRFQMYDYGVQGNLNKYKRKHPPIYDLAEITLPISLFSSPSDWLSSMSDVKTLLTKLKNIYIHHVVRRDDFSHMDFVWAKDAPELVFSPLLEILDQIAPMKEKRKNNLLALPQPTDEITAEDD